MTYINTPETFSTLEIAENQTVAAAMEQAAQEIPGITVDVLPNDSEESIKAAAKQYAQVAHDMNMAYAHNAMTDTIEYNPSDHEKTAERIQRSGGFMVRLTATSASGDGYPSTTAFRERTRQLTQK